MGIVREYVSARAETHGARLPGRPVHDCETGEEHETHLVAAGAADPAVAGHDPVCREVDVVPSRTSRTDGNKWR
jgi:hypothetical protein